MPFAVDNFCYCYELLLSWVLLEIQKVTLGWIGKGEKHKHEKTENIKIRNKKVRSGKYERNDEEYGKLSRN